MNALSLRSHHEKIGGVGGGLAEVGAVKNDFFEGKLFIPTKHAYTHKGEKDYGGKNS